MVESAMLLTLKRAVKRVVDTGLRPLGYSRPEPSYLPDILGFKMFQNPRDAGINYAGMRGRVLADSRFGEIALAQTVKPGDVVLDLGANVGFFTLLYSRQVGPTGHVHAFEPGIQSNALLQTNIAINNLTNVTAYRSAVADYDGHAKFLLCATGDSDNRLLDNSGEQRQEISTKVVTIDAMFAGAKIDFIKMDVQGAELMALKGMQKTIAANPAIRMLVEFAPQCLLQASTSPVELLALISALGLSISILHEDKPPELISDDWLLKNCGAGKFYPHLNLLLSCAH